MHTMTRKSLKLMQRGFTLIELLIVVIILAILAAIVIPQFTNATVDAQEAALDANLNALRSAIELYQVQHGGQYPGAAASTTTACATKGTGAAGSAQAVIDQLTNFSNAAGGTCAAADASTPLGPYIRRGIPADPITNNAAIAINAAPGTPLAPGGAVGGWAYDTVTGQIVMNSNAVDRNGAAYSTH